MEKTKHNRSANDRKLSTMQCVSCGAELPRPQDDRVTYYLLRVGEVPNNGDRGHSEVQGATLCCDCGSWVLNLIDTWSTATNGKKRAPTIKPVNLILVPTTAPGLNASPVLVNAERIGATPSSGPRRTDQAPDTAPADAKPAEWPVQLDGAQPFTAS